MLVSLTFNCYMLILSLASLITLNKDGNMQAIPFPRASLKPLCLFPDTHSLRFTAKVFTSFLKPGAVCCCFAFQPFHVLFPQPESSSFSSLILRCGSRQGTLSIQLSEELYFCNSGLSDCHLIVCLHI